MSATAQDHIVFIVDDDRRIRESLCDLLSTFDLRAVAFGTAAEYIAHAKPDVPACLILDVQLPDINGLDLQSQMSQENHPQIVFVTGYGDIPASVPAIKAGGSMMRKMRASSLAHLVNMAAKLGIMPRDLVTRCRSLMRTSEEVRGARATAYPTGSWIADHPNVKAYASPPGSRNSISNV